MRLLVIFSILLSLVACSSSPKKVDDRNLGEIGKLKLRLISNEPIEVDYDTVIDSYLSYLEVSTDSEMRIRAAHRIADLKFEKENRKMQGHTAEKPAQVFHGIDDTDRFLAKASINDYEKLLKKYPDRQDNDLLYYQLAKAYFVSGRLNQSIVALENLIEKYPESQFFLESLFRLGEMLFEVGDFEMSALNYEKVVNYETDNNPYYMHAQYLAGWSYYRAGQYEKSLLSFTELLDETFPTDEVMRSASGVELDILRDSLAVMASTFDIVGDWKDIQDFYQRNGQRYYEYRLYAELSNHYFEKEYYQFSAHTLEEYVNLYPEDDKAVLFFRRLIFGYEKADFPEVARNYKSQFINNYGVDSQYWNDNDEDVKEFIQITLSGYLQQLASYEHESNQTTFNPIERTEHFERAEKWYLEYIRSFPEAEDVAEAHFLLAELYFENGHFPAAKDNYEIVAYQFPNYEAAAESGYAALLAYDNHASAEPEVLMWDLQKVASASRFVAEYPEDKRRGQVLVNMAELLLSHQYYKQALIKARSAQQAGISLEPKYRYGAALVQGHSAFELGFFSEAEQAFLIAIDYADIEPEERSSIRTKLAAAIYKQGEAVKDSNPEMAIEHWTRLVQTVPESELVESAEYDVTALLMQTEKYAEAEVALLEYRSKYPNSEYINTIIDRLIVAYEQQEKWDSAAFELKALASNESRTQEQQRVALFQSAGYFEKAENYDEAIKTYKTYAHGYSSPFDISVEAHHKMDKLYELQGEHEKRKFWLNKIISIHNESGQLQTERSQYLAARASFILAEYSRIEFDEIPLYMPISKSLVEKNAPMQEAINRYTQALEFKVLEFTTPSVFYMGDMYAGFASALLNSERPEGMDELEAEEYQFLLEDEAYPLEEAAINIHKTNVNRTYEGLYDKWIKKSFESLADLVPGQYDKPEKVVNYVENIR